MNSSFRKGFQKVAKKMLDKHQKDYLNKVVIPGSALFGLHGAAFAPKGARAMKFFESASRGALAGLIVGAGMNIKKRLYKD